MKEDKHLKVIERSTMDNEGSQALMLYRFIDGFEVKLFRMEHGMLTELAKKHGACVEVKRGDGI